MSTTTTTAPRSATSTDVGTRINDLIAYIQQGRIIDAMQEFYAADVEMQENANPPTVGLAPNIEREKQFLAQVKQWKGFTVKALAVGDGVSFIENTIEFVNTAGQDVKMEQVAVQRWKNGRITHERFYYNAGK